MENVDANVEEHMLKAEKTLGTMLDYLGLEANIKAELKPEKIILMAASEDAGRIIGRKGQSLESLQLLINRMMQKGEVEFPRIYIDVDGYSRKPSSGSGSGSGSRKRREGGRGGRGGRGRGREDGDGGSEDFDQDEERIRQQALDAAKEVKRWGESQTLPPMNSHNRRIVHITLRDDEEIITESDGDGSMKKVVISLKRQDG